MKNNNKIEKKQTQKQQQNNKLGEKKYEKKAELNECRGGSRVFLQFFLFLSQRLC